MNHTTIGILTLTVAATATAWAVYAPVDFELGELNGLNPSEKLETGDIDLQSIFAVLDSDQLARPLRPNIEPPIVKQDKQAPKVIGRPTPSLKTRLTLIGTVIQPTQKHAVFKGAINQSLVVFEGKELPSPNAGVILSVVGKDSVTLSIELDSLNWHFANVTRKDRCGFVDLDHRIAKH